ncbi:hypothetical protein ORI20_03180 [Mycobacterium sp. CVI_P3]|uniref:Transcriptional regulator n=1 Tax=Mycobacterium pinniadriaticum TaxID=2994102 RepID=A0ABT3S865_9MYCO|nr:hypothetical protein [Mycobacterium pinniadriaticum]MCX2929263.1 hypothetical protein [Mycobacterium pinniadriaticum]MCX2935688.1 hypothetical protein [Mycobacterium pinniadriaticum]
MDNEALRDVSRGLFGNRHKLEVIAAIARMLAAGVQEVYPRMVSKKVTEAADKQVVEVFNQLEKGGLLIPVADKTDRQQIHWYRPRESGVWEIALALVDEFRAAPWTPDELGSSTDGV